VKHKWRAEVNFAFAPTCRPLWKIESEALFDEVLLSNYERGRHYAIKVIFLWQFAVAKGIFAISTG
jgi:hypothetical protein